MKDIRESLNIKIESPYWDKAYALAQSEKDIPEWLTEDYLKNLHDNFGLLRINYEIFISALPYVTEVSELCLLAKTLYYIIAERKSAKESFTHLEFPKAPEGVENTIGYDCVGISPIIAHMMPTWKELEDRGVEGDVLSDSLATPDHLFTYSVERLGKNVFGEVEFLLYDVAVYINYLTIGRLRFEICQNTDVHFRAFENNEKEICILMDNAQIHKSGHILGSYKCDDNEGSFSTAICENDSCYEGHTVDKHTRLVQSFSTQLSKNEWKPVFSSGDNAIKVHIPYGGRLDNAECERSYERAKETFSRCFPEIKFKGFILNCWMLSPKLCDILPDSSNIILFRNKYNVFPIKNSAVDAYMYVFGFRGSSVDELNLNELPETNSLMRGIKEKSLNGEFIHQFGGFFPW